VTIIHPAAQRRIDCARGHAATAALVSAGAVCATLAACSSSAPADPTPAVLAQYTVDLVASYSDTVTQVRVLADAVDAFVAAPSADGLTACQSAWRTAHQAYGESEYSRFYGGPIDQAQGGMNEWPIDESFIDYTAQAPTGGIINDPTDYPAITAQILATADEKGGLENLSTGFHAVEFLLWGQRVDQTLGPGTRPFTDFVDGGTADNQDRRRVYLQTATTMLLADMTSMVAAWNLADPASYASTLAAESPHDALSAIFRGVSQMAISELLYERLDDPFVSQDQKDEESCFSESTIDDLIANGLGIEDAYLGHYRTAAGATLEGPSISDLVKAKNPALDAQLRQELAAVRAAIGAIPPPFDHAVLAADTAPEHIAVKAAIDAFQPMQGLLDQAATELGIVNNL
jgi:putative iron-regulated protein